MARKPQKNRKTRAHAPAGFFTKLLVLALLAGLSWQLVRMHAQVEQAQTEREQLAAQVDVKQQENDALTRDIENGGSQEQMEGIARDELGMVSPGEKVFYDVSN